jgi:hypothetical protein
MRNEMLSISEAYTKKDKFKCDDKLYLTMLSEED